MDYLTWVAQQHARRCLARFSSGVSDPLVRREAKRQAKYWLKSIAGKSHLGELDRDECLLVVQLATDAGRDGVVAAILAGTRRSRWKPTQRKRAAYRRRSNPSWRRPEDDVR